MSLLVGQDIGMEENKKCDLEIDLEIIFDGTGTGKKKGTQASDCTLPKT